jgi:hypothetical protein
MLFVSFDIPVGFAIEARHLTVFVHDQVQFCLISIDALCLCLSS